ncbi:MAG TPA: glycoside hydrolase family 88 protein [Candidatus Acidoferrum sp.]|nr:glycoside hydrolase family 88 protein [Candidatus Acidoferrum sp.]
MSNRTLPGLTRAMIAWAFAAAPLLQADDMAWPKGASPQEVGRRVAEHFVLTPHGNVGRTNAVTSIIYPETCAWYGALTFAQLTTNHDLTSHLLRRFEPLFGDDATLVPRPVNVDSTVFGSVPLEIFMQTREQKYLDMGQPIADAQWTTPTGAARARLSDEVLGWVNRGLSWQSRFWIDDMYMISLVQVQAFRATGQPPYLDHAALEMTAYLDQLQQTNGLFFHAPDVPFFWGRGNGWVAAGMTELLRSLPDNHPRRARILAGYKKMMASLLKFQGEDGLWRQLIDHPESFPETSGSGMFAFAMITGVKDGWLDEPACGAAARRAWLALVQKINDQSDISDVCEGTSKRNDLQYYLTRRRITGDLHGQAPILWCASAWLRPSAAPPGPASRP